MGHHEEGRARRLWTFGRERQPEGAGEEIDPAGRDVFRSGGEPRIRIAHAWKKLECLPFAVLSGSLIGGFALRRNKLAAVSLELPHLSCKSRSDTRSEECALVTRSRKRGNP